MELEIEKPINLVFEPESHTYSNKDTGEVFISATTLIGQYKTKFNTHYWSMYSGLKGVNIPVRHNKDELYITVSGVTQHINTLYSNMTYAGLAEKMKRQWKAKTDRANVRGNKIHDYLEDSINESRGDKKAKDNDLINPLSIKGEKSTELVIFRTKHDLDATDLEETYPVIYARLLMYINGGCTLIAEKRVYTSRYAVAGMIDVLIIKKKWFWILDWKTNKDEIKFESGYYKKVKDAHGFWVKGTEFVRTDDRMRVPLNRLQVCKGTIYSLQLSLYSYLMELWGYIPAKNHLEIFHMRPRRVPQLLKIKNYRTDIINMIEHHKSNNEVVYVQDKKEDLGFGII